MPLTEKVTFKIPLEACNKIQIPKIIRWQFKLDPQQVLHVEIHSGSAQETFYAKTGKDGRIHIPKTVTYTLFGKTENLAGYLLEISLEPT